MGWLFVGQKKGVLALFGVDIISPLRIRIAPLLFHIHKHPGSLEDELCPVWLFIQTPNADFCSAASHYIESSAVPAEMIIQFY